VEVYFGSAIKNLADIVGGHATESPLQRAFFWFGVVFTLFMTTYITWWLRKELSRELQKYEHYEPPSEQRSDKLADASLSNAIEMSSILSTSLPTQNSNPSDGNTPPGTSSLSSPSKKYIFNTTVAINSDLLEVELDSTPKRKLNLIKKLSINNMPQHQGTGNQGNGVIESQGILSSIERTIKNSNTKPSTPR